MNVGGVFGRDAGIGFGPRLTWKNGYTNLPHAWQSTLHGGIALEPKIGNFSKRFRPLVDADLRGGFALAAKNSVQRNIARGDTNFDGAVREVDDENDDNNEGVVMPVFGLNIGIGFTF
jgi:hypothetical protein